MLPLATYPRMRDHSTFLPVPSFRRSACLPFFSCSSSCNGVIRTNPRCPSRYPSRRCTTGTATCRRTPVKSLDFADRILRTQAGSCWFVCPSGVARDRLSTPDRACNMAQVPRRAWAWCNATDYLPAAALTRSVATLSVPAPSIWKMHGSIFESKWPPATLSYRVCRRLSFFTVSC